MSSTLGVLDVLSRLREEFERASTALVAQEDANRAILERCRHAEKESGRSGPMCEELRKHKAQLEDDLRAAETRRQDAQGRLRRLQKEKARRESTAAQKREAARATADQAIESSKKFRSDTSARLRQIGELRARLREKTGELKRIQEESKELDDEIGAKTAARDKVKAEVKSRREALAAAVSMADSIEQENKAMLNRAKTVENEIDEVRQTQEEMQEIASGLRQKNAVLRNELRNLKRTVVQQDQEGRDAQETAMSPSSGSAARSHHSGRRGGGAASRRVRELDLRPSKEYPRPEKGSQSHDQSPKETGMAGAGHYYHYAAAPLQQHEAPRPQDSQLGSISCRRSWDHRAGSNSSSNITSSGNSVRAPFRTAAEAMGMPELRLSSPHPGARTGNNATNPSPFSRQPHHVAERPTQW